MPERIRAIGAQPIAVDHPQNGTRNYVFRLGHKGKNIGVLGVYVGALALLRAPELEVASGVIKRFLPGR